MTIAGVRSTLADDLYVVLVNWENVSAAQAPFKVYHNPLVNWLWIGSLMFIFGFLVAAWPERRGRKAGRENMKTKSILLLDIFLPGYLRLSSSRHAAVSAQQPTPSDDEVNAIARQLYCPVCENTPLDVCPDHSLPPVARTHPPDAGRREIRS